MINKFSKLALCTFLAIGSVEVNFEPGSDFSDFYNINEVIPALTSGLNWSISINKALAYDTTPRDSDGCTPYGGDVGVCGEPPEEWDWGDWEFEQGDWMDSDWGSDDGGSGGGASESSDEECAGNPIMVANGEKVEYEIDFVGKEQHPLALTRNYSSLKEYNGAFGKGWSSSFEKRLELRYPAKTVFRPDGKRVILFSATIDVPYVGRKTGYKSSSGKNYLYQDGSGNWIFRNESDQNEIYDSQGRLIQVSFAEKPDQLIYFGTLQILSFGISHKYSYNSNGKLATITHSNGRKLHLSWSGDRISTVTDNAGNIYSYSYNSNGMLSSVRFPDNVLKSYHYEDTRFKTALTGVSVGGSRYSWFSYDANGRAIESKHAGDVEKHSFEFGGDYSTVTNPLNQKTTYRYTSYEKNKVKTIERDGTPYCAASNQATTYDTKGRKKTETDWNGNITDYTYNDKGQITKEIYAYGTPEQLTVTYSWHPTLNKIIERIEPGKKQIFEYDDRQNLVKSELVADGKTYTTRMEHQYYPSHIISKTTITSPENETTVLDFDSAGNLIKHTNTLGHITTYSQYDALGHARAIIYPDGTGATYQYDVRQRIKSKTIKAVDGKSNTLTYKYNPFGSITEQWSNSGPSFIHTYDQANRLIKTKLGYNSVINRPNYDSIREYGYDALGHLISETYSKGSYTDASSCDGDIFSVQSGGPITLDPTPPEDGIDPPDCGGDYVTTNSFRTKYVYDANGFLVHTVNDVNQQMSSYTYDANGNLLTAKDGRGYITTYTYDALNRLISQKDPNGKITDFTHDANGLSMLRDARYNATDYSRNGLSQVETLTSPDTNVTRYNYDLMGRLQDKTDARNILTRYQYDGLGRITKKLNATTHSWGYDNGTNAKGKLTSFSDDSGSTSYQYGVWGSLSGQTNVIQGASYQTNWGYDNYGRVNTLTYPGGNKVTYLTNPHEWRR